MNLFEHGHGCSPLTPCGGCELVAWLRASIPAEVFAELVTRAKALNPPKRSYRRRPAAGNNEEREEATQ